MPAEALVRSAAMEAEKGWGEGHEKFKINDTEFAVLRGGPYDGLKLSRTGKSERAGRGNQIGLPTPQYIQKCFGIDFNGPGSNLSEEADFGPHPDSSYKFVQCDEANTEYEFKGDEVIAVYTASPLKKKYKDVFTKVTPQLEKFSGVLNVTVFLFDFYARFSDIDVEVE